MRRILTIPRLGALALAAHVASALAATPGSAAQAPAAFDGARAWEHLKQLVSIGPRVAGSEGIVTARAYIRREISALDLTLAEQAFTVDTPQGPVAMVNLIVRLPGKRTDKILFTGHYDTKLFKDQLFVGANDGGSSAAFLIELARALKDRPRELTYELVWFDGEEAFCREWSECGSAAAPDNTYGSRHYVRAAREAGTLSSIRAMILVDMIADRDLVFRREAHSSPWLKDIIWNAARRLGHGAVFSPVETPIEDDHIPFIQAGVPAVDIIDLEYPPWHNERGQDTLDAISPRGLQIVGDVLLAAVPEIEARGVK